MAQGSFNHLLGRAWEENVPFSALLELTYSCNLDCAFCYNDVRRRAVPLSTPRWLELLDEMKELGIFWLTLSGGEPLAHPDFWAIGRKARELEFVLKVKSNGHAIGPEVARRLRAEIEPAVVDVSLHGAAAESHDRQTRVVGSFAKLVRNVEEMRSAGLNVKLNATLTRWNEAELEQMYAVADALGVPLQVEPNVSPRDDGDRSTLDIAASAEAIRRSMEILWQRRSRGIPERTAEVQESAEAPARKHCGAGSSALAIDPFGDVLPCVQWRRPLGNVREMKLRDVWRPTETLQEIRDLAREAGRRVTGLGSAGRSIGFCPGLAEATTGSPVALYPIAAIRTGLRAETAEELWTRGDPVAT